MGDDAAALWRLADQAAAEARELRRQADALDREAARWNTAASEMESGKSLSEALRV